MKSEISPGKAMKNQANLDNTHTARWLAFHASVQEYFRLNPQGYQSLLEKMQQEVGFSKYATNIQALKMAISRIKTGTGAMREPLLLEYLMKLVAWDPRDLFGTGFLPNAVERMDTHKLAREIGSYVLGQMRAENEEALNLTGGPAAKLKKLYPIAQMIVGFSVNYQDDHLPMIASLYSWFNATWNQLVPKQKAELGPDEKIWRWLILNITGPTNPRKADAILVLFTLYAFHTIRRILDAISAGGKSTRKDLRFGITYATGENEASLGELLDELQVAVQREAAGIINTRHQFTQNNRTIVRGALVSLGIFLSRVFLYTVDFEVHAFTNEVEADRQLLRMVLVRKTQSPLRMVQTVHISVEMFDALRQAHELLIKGQSRNQAELAMYLRGLEGQAKSPENEGQAVDGVMPFFWAHEIQAYIDQGVFELKDKDRWKTIRVFRSSEMLYMQQVYWQNQAFLQHRQHTVDQARQKRGGKK
jgi:hypothetical protein